MLKKTMKSLLMLPHIIGSLEYMACDDEQCLRPLEVPSSVSINNTANTG